MSACRVDCQKQIRRRPKRYFSAQVPNLYGPEEMDAIMSACSVDCQKKQITPTKTNIFAQYVVRVEESACTCLCMSPLGARS